MSRTSVEIRTDLVEAVRLDLVGPDNNHAFAQEVIPDPPQRWYLTGFLVPSGAPSEQRSDKQSDDQIDSGGTADRICRYFEGLLERGTITGVGPF